jgi:hypothetical protein
MTWYEIVLFVASAFFLLSTVGSLLFGGMDMDFDAEVDAGSLLSDVFSFKGLIHFAIGFSLVLTLRHETGLVALAAGVITGVVFAVALYYLYRLMYKKAQQSLQYTYEIKDLEAEVYFWNSERRIGEVFITLEGRPVAVTIHCPEGVELKTGQKLKVSGTRKLVTPSSFETVII